MSPQKVEVMENSKPPVTISRMKGCSHRLSCTINYRCSKEKLIDSLALHVLIVVECKYGLESRGNSVRALKFLYNCTNMMEPSNGK